MAVTLNVDQALSATAQSVKDQNGKTSPLTLSTDKVGIGTADPISKLHILSAANDAPPRFQSSPGGTGAFAAGLDFYSGETGKGYVGCPDVGAGFGGGELLLFGAAGTRISLWPGANQSVVLDTNGNVGIGTSEPTEKLEVNGNILATGDIRLKNADCAEDFTIGTDVLVDPGTVMVLGEEGALYPSQHAYDKRVAGVVSGAGDYQPGIVLDKQESDRTRQPIALLGKVYCKVDAGHGAIEIGDLLTTSPTPGHAMRAADPLKAFGAVIGKALRPLPEGCGLIPILIALQ